MSKPTNLKNQHFPPTSITPDILALQDDSDGRLELIETASDCHPIEGFARVDVNEFTGGISITPHGMATVQL